MRKLLIILILGLISILLNSCQDSDCTMFCDTVGQTNGNSSGVMISNRGLRHLEMPAAYLIASEHCQKYDKEAFYRGYDDHYFIYGCQ